ncbi:MAG: isoprenyl transferase [Chromatiales bacterium]|nr:isoprenyl transferase [Chromatiales bacterium]
MADNNSNTKTLRHLAIIMDGNGRWARKRFLPRFAGHRAGLEAVRKTIKSCVDDQKIEVLTLFTFSSENWRRPAEEVGLLMKLFMTALDNEVKKLHERGVRVRVIGELDAFPPELQQRIAAAEALTENNTTLSLNFAANYGGRWDITQAARKLAEQVERGELRSEEITEQKLAQMLCLADLPEPDLFIRTGGEQRVSNFLLWQLAYTEYYFTDLLWPDFNADSLQQAIDSFSKRERRFGRTSEQVKGEDDA